MQLEPERFEHPSACRIRKRGKLASSNRESIQEGGILPRRSFSLVRLKLVFLDPDLRVKVSHTRLNALDEHLV
ncbi:hypothetical protein ABZ820_10875 [Streptomyces diacarni]|uniref:hypothetical protein n=1 Tax=Streptomyces diacarni TaxID=2800381 RepID=UPI0033D311A0